MLKVGHFAPFSKFLHIKGRNFFDVDVFIVDVFSVHVYICFYEPCKVSWKSVRTFSRNPECRQTDADRQTWQLYINFR